MRAKVIYTVGALLCGMLILSACQSGSTGGAGVPCNDAAECGQGLLCAAGKCSTGKAGSACDPDDTDTQQCTANLKCRTGNVCGGHPGDRCIVGDADCITGLICAGVENNKTCGGTEGALGNACQVNSHCRSGLICDDDLTCAWCTADDQCTGSQVCTGAVGSQTCNDADTGAIREICGNDDHCTDSLVCGRENGQCGIAAGNTCVVMNSESDSDCAGSLVCTGASGSQTCSTASFGAIGQICGNDDHCTGSLVCSGENGQCGVVSGGACATSNECAGSLVCGISDVCSTGMAGASCNADDQCTGPLVCTGVIGIQICSTAGTGVFGAICGFDSHCTDGRVCSAGACAVASGGTCTADSQCADPLVCRGMVGMQTCGIDAGGPCTADDQCAGALVCTGALGMQTCSTASGGNVGEICGIDSHCDNGRLCDAGTCRIATGNTCRGDDQCFGSLICVGAGSSTTCRQPASGVFGDPCGIDSHCIAPLLCGNGGCRRAAGSTCTHENQCASLICGGPVGMQTCRASAGGSCTADNQCDVSLVCTGASGSQTCNTAGTGAAGQICGNNNHCTTPATLICGSSNGLCGGAIGAGCMADNQCADALVCDTGTSTCAVAAGGSCTASSQCTGTLVCEGVPGSQTCVIAVGMVQRVGSATAFGVNETTPRGLAYNGTNLYMVGASTNKLYTINTSTGVASEVGSIPENSSGIAFYNNVMYLSSRGNTNTFNTNDDSLYTITITTAAASLVADFNGASETSPAGLAGHNNVLYMLGQDDFGMNGATFYSLDPSDARLSHIGGGTWFDSQTNAYNPSGLESVGGTLYFTLRGLVEHAGLYSMDITTGNGTRIGSIDGFGVSELGPTGIAAIGDVLYMVGDDTDALYIIRYQ